MKNSLPETSFSDQIVQTLVGCTKRHYFYNILTSVIDSITDVRLALWSRKDQYQADYVIGEPTHLRTKRNHGDTSFAGNLWALKFLTVWNLFSYTAWQVVKGIWNMILIRSKLYIKDHSPLIPPTHFVDDKMTNCDGPMHLSCVCDFCWSVHHCVLKFWHLIPITTRPSVGKYIKLFPRMKQWIITFHDTVLRVNPLFILLKILRGATFKLPWEFWVALPRQAPPETVPFHWHLVLPY